MIAAKVALWSALRQAPRQFFLGLERAWFSLGFAWKFGAMLHLPYRGRLRLAFPPRIAFLPEKREIGLAPIEALCNPCLMDAFSQILARLDAIKAMQSALAAEAADLAIAARVLKTFQSESPRSNLEGNRPVPREGTKADIIIGIMNSSPDPWTTGDKVREEFSRIKGVNVEIGSISPLLTKLKGEGKIVREGLKIALAARLEKTEAPDAVAQEAS